MDETNALTISGGNLPLRNFSELEKAGEIISKTKMLGCSNPAEGFILVSTCVQERMSFLKFKQKYHIIAGEISQKAENMLAELRKHAGRYEIISRTPDIVDILFECQGAKYRETVTWEELKKESYVYQKDKRTLKDNYSTPRRRMQMMWARAVSDGVRTVCPEATQGSYTPEEIGDFRDDSSIKDVTSEFENASEESPIAAAIPIETVPAIVPPESGEVAPPIPLAATSAPSSVPSATIAPPPIAAAPIPEAPSPFVFASGASATQAIASDPAFCPTGPEKGKAWYDVPAATRKLILASAFTPGITPAHREAIKQSLAEGTIK